MKVEEIEKLSRRELRAKANACLEMSELHVGPSKLIEAQFYMRELEHRADSWVSIRDLSLEIVVILLIGWEIHMGYRQESQQTEAFASQQTIWKNMETSSSATADSLVAVKGTMEAMNTALQKQLALFYDVSITAVFDQEKKGLTFINNGRTNISIWGFKIGEDAPSIEKEGRTIAPGAAYKVDGAAMYDSIIARFPRPMDGLIPFEVYAKNERGEEFIAHDYLGLHWVKDVGLLNTQTTSITPEHWSSAMKNTKITSGKTH
jgi:hypothetical protein